MSWPASEEDLAAVVVEWLQDLGWDVYQEVQMRTYGERCDIVAVQGRLLWAIECKRSLSLSVMAQADYWRGYAHLCSVAVPHGRRAGEEFALRILGERGIGCLLVGESAVRELSAPSLHRKARVDRLRGCLVEAQKHAGRAGNASSQFYTPFRETCRGIAFYVASHPGCTLAELLGSMQTHYRSTKTARACIPIWARAGKIPGVRVEEGRELRLWPAEISR